MPSTLKITGGRRYRPQDFLPQESDVLLALTQQKARILARTARGVDVNGARFAPYNDTRPYYFYPTGPVAKARTGEGQKRDERAVKRFAGEVGRTKKAVSRSGLGLRFPSYAAFKLEYLGRSNVDLFGPRAPHMLQQMVIRTEGDSRGVLGIYGEAGARANGLSSENRPKGMPRRYFFGVSDADAEAMTETVVARIQERLRRL